MNSADILRMAQEADVWVAGQEPYQTQLVRFAELVAKAEREACAKVCLEKHANGNWKYDTRDECHDAIRARSKT